MLLLVANYARSQETCNCGGTGIAYSIVGNSVLLSQSGLPAGGVNNACLSIDGTLVIDAAAGNYLMQNMEIKMYPGSFIRIINGGNLEVRNSNIHGCTAMWKGIGVEHGSALIFTGNTIADAEFAIGLPTAAQNQSGPGAAVHVVGNTFRKNFIGIGQSYANPFSNLPSPFTAFHSNEFHCEGLTLLPKYTGQPTSPGNISAAGVELRFLAGTVIGDGNLAHANTFHHMANGIILEGGTATINSCKIHDIGVDNTYPSNLISGYGVHVMAADLNITGWGLDIADPAFSNVPTGLYANISNLTATELTMIGVSTGFRVETGVNCSISVSGNYIYCDNIGIDLWQNQQALSLTVQENEIHVDELSPSDPLKGTGIAINEDPNILPNTTRSILDNIIYAYGANFGITANSIMGYRISGNHVTFDQATAKSGVQIDNGRDCFFICNAVSGVAGGNSQANTSYKISATTGSEYDCNYSYQTRTGFRFLGVCSGSPNLNTVVKGNMMVKNSRGFWMGPDAIFGSLGNLNIQLHKGNTWFGPFGSITAIHEGLPAQLGYSLFEVHTNLFPYFPVNFQTPGAPSYPWFYVGNGTPFSCDPFCSLGDPDEITNDTIGGFGLDIARDSLAFPSLYAPNMNWILKRLLYRRLSDAPALLNQSPDLQQFHVNESNTPAGKFTAIDQSTEQLLRVNATTRQHLSSLYAGISSIKRQLDSLARQPLSSLTFYAIQQDAAAKRPLQMRIDSLWSAAGAVSAMFATNRDSLADQALTLNNAISTSEVFEENELLVNGIYLNSILKGRNALTAAEQGTLEDIAAQCPALGGNAVFRARSILAFDGSLRYYDDDELCEYAEPREMTVEKPAAYDDQLFIISPNPAREYIQIRHTGSGTENWKMEITDAFGRVIDMKQFRENEGELSTKEYAPGLYFLHFQVESGLRAVKKLVVSR